MKHRPALWSHLGYSHKCCGTAARRVYQRGFYVAFGSDPTTTDASELGEAELRTLRRGAAWAMTAEESVAALQAG